jgi:hypothetical protein
VVVRMKRLFLAVPASTAGRDELNNAANTGLAAFWASKAANASAATASDSSASVVPARVLRAQTQGGSTCTWSKVGECGRGRRGGRHSR